MADYMIYQDQQDIKFQQPRASSFQQHNEVPIVRESNHRQEYQRIMSFKGVDISRQSLISKLRQHHIYEEGLANFCQLSFPNIQSSKNCEIMEVDVHLGWLLLKIRIINVDVKGSSPVHGCTCIGGGSFGKIYRYVMENTVKAIKCFDINPRNRIEDYLTLAIAQYCLLKIASIAGSGPAMNSEGFDIFFYKSELINKEDNSVEKRYCIEFETQCCEAQSNFCTEDRQSLFKSLHSLHLLNLVHCDIKPDNIMYSPTLEKWVFIDFGVSTILRESYGHCSKTKYRGTLKYSSEEMKRLYENLYIYKQQSEEYIDLFWNDVHGLKLSCNDIQKRENTVTRNHQTEKDKDPTSIQQHFLLADFKYCLYFGNKQLQQYYIDSIKWDKINRLNIVYFLFQLKSISEKTRALFAHFLQSFSVEIELVIFQKLLSDIKSSLNYDEEEAFVCQEQVKYKRLFFREIPESLETARLQNYHNQQLVEIHQTRHIENVIDYIKSYQNEGGNQDAAYLSVIFTVVNFLKSKYGTNFSKKVEVCKIFYKQRGNKNKLTAGVDYIKYFISQAMKICLHSKKSPLHDYFIQIFANALMLGLGSLDTIKAAYSTVFTISSNSVKTCQYFLHLYYLNFWSEQTIYDEGQKDYQQIKIYIVSVMNALCLRLQAKEDQLHRHCEKPEGFCMEMEEKMLKRIESEAFSAKINEQSSFQLMVRRCQQTLKLFRTRLKRPSDEESYYSNIQEIPMNLTYFFIQQFYVLNTQSYARISYVIDRFISCQSITDQWGFVLKMKTFYKLHSFQQFQNVEIFHQAGARKNVQRIRTYYEIIIQERYSEEDTMEAQHIMSELIVRNCERALFELGNAYSEEELASILMKLKEIQARGIWHYLTLLLANNKERVVNTLKLFYDKVGRQKCLVRKDHLLFKLGEFMLRKQLTLPEYKLSEQDILNSRQKGSLLDIKLKYLQERILEAQANTKSAYLIKFHQITQRNNRYNDFLLKTIIFKVYISLLELLIKQLRFKEAIDLICKISQNLLYLLSKKTALLSKKINMLLHYLFITKRYNHFKHWQHFRTLWVEKTLQERNKIASFYNLTIVFIDFNAYELTRSVYNEQNVPQLVVPSNFHFLEGEVLKKLLYGYSKFLISKIPIFQIYEVEMYYKLMLHYYSLKESRHEYAPILFKRHLFRLHMKSLVNSCPIDYQYALLAEKTKYFQREEYHYQIYVHRGLSGYKKQLQVIVKQKFREKVDALIHPHEGIINKMVRICK